MTGLRQKRRGQDVACQIKLLINPVGKSNISYKGANKKKTVGLKKKLTQVDSRKRQEVYFNIFVNFLK
jgi:hypothetical protein